MGKQKALTHDLLTVSGISKRGEDNFVLDRITFSQKKFGKIAVAGETGSGKSTLLKIIAGLVQPDSGEVIFEDERIKGPDDKLVAGHPQISYLSQDFELAKFLRVEQVLEYANKLGTDESERLFRICRVDHLVKRKTDKLSGGEKQRIALCRLLIGYPKLLLLDEPFSHLDLAHKNILKSVIHDISETLKITCILVSHDPLDTLSWADKILVMKNGQVIQQGSPMKIYTHPVNEYAAGLFGKYNLVDPKKITIPKGDFKKLDGQVLIRPEEFQIAPRLKAFLKGKVTEAKFFGSYHELRVTVNGQSILIRTNNSLKKNGDTIYLTVKRV